ncbi:MAG: hypothetical protein J6C81_05625 [Muribaculaceae bacterium]|nr:hypothetical protein [Muribaculaceae bacterium]
MKISIKPFVSIALLACAFFTAVPSADARRGEKSVGINGGYASYNDGGYAALNFQYSFADHVRIAPEIGYVFRNKGCSAFEASIDMHFPFRLAKGVGIYPLTGLTLNDWNYRDDGHATRLGVDFGAGFDFYLTSYLKLNAQAKYSLMNDTGGWFAGVGIGYVF